MGKLLISILGAVLTSGCTHVNTLQKTRQPSHPELRGERDSGQTQGLGSVMCTHSSGRALKQAARVDANPSAEQVMSYQEIIKNINDINTQKTSNARVKNIIKEYRYNVSDDDSKNSARKKAINAVKLLILDEIGVFVESYLEISKVVDNKQHQEQLRHEIKTLTAGVVKTEVLDERFDGSVYYVKASVLVDPDSVSEGISEILKIKANKGEIDKLSQLLERKEKEVDMRSQEVIQLQKRVATQTLLNTTKEHALRQIQAELKRAEKQLQTHQAHTRRVKSQLDKINHIIATKTNKAMTYVERGMLYSEVVAVAGRPRVTTKSTYGQLLNYGKVMVHLEDSVVSCITNMKHCEAEWKCVNYTYQSLRKYSPACILK